MSKSNGSEDRQNSAKRADWENNHWLIYDAYVQYFADHRRPPTQTKLAELTGLHRDTIATHIKDTTLLDIIPSVKMRTMRVLNGLASRAEKGFAAEVKLWMQVVEKWRESIALEHSGSVITSISVEVHGSKSKMLDLDAVKSNGNGADES